MKMMLFIVTYIYFFQLRLQKTYLIWQINIYFLFKNPLPSIDFDWSDRIFQNRINMGTLNHPFCICNNDKHDKNVTSSRRCSTVCTMAWAYSSPSSASMVSMFMSGLLFTFRSSRLFLYSITISAAPGITA